MPQRKQRRMVNILILRGVLLEDIRSGLGGDNYLYLLLKIINEKGIKYNRTGWQVYGKHDSATLRPLAYFADLQDSCHM